MKRTYAYLTLAISMAAVSPTLLAADKGTAGEERCIPINQIQRTEVVDDQNVLFYMRDKQVYNNHLPQRCTGLAMAKAFKYATAQSQLCNVDIISPLGHTTGEVVPGASCGLGMFVPTTAAPKQN